MSATADIGRAPPRADRRAGRRRHAADACRGRPAPPLVVALPGQRRFLGAACGADVAPVVVGSFPNGELHLELAAEVAGRRCVIVGSIAPPPGDLERLTLVGHTLQRAGAERITAVLPYLAYARQDRAGASESLGLALAGALLRAASVDDVVSVDVHSPHASALLGLPVATLSPAGLIAAALPEPWRSEATFVAPDEGAIERCRALARAAGSTRPVVWLPKRRSRTGVEHSGAVGTPGRCAVVVDDILDTGGTLVSCCRRLQGAGVEEIGVVVTHGLFTGTAWRQLLDERVRRIWTTDTVLSRRRPDDVEIVPVSGLLAPTFAGPDE